MNSSDSQCEMKPAWWRLPVRGLWALLILLALYFLYGWNWQRSAVNEILQIQESFQSEEAKGWTPEQRTQFSQRLQHLQKSLSPESRKDLVSRGEKLGMKRIEAHFDKLLSLPRAELAKELDQIINQTEKGRQEREKRLLELRQKKTIVAPKSNEFKLDNQGLANLLDQTNPELRAKFHLFVAEVNKRRQERNLPPWHPLHAD